MRLVVYFNAFMLSEGATLEKRSKLLTRPGGSLFLLWGFIFLMAVRNGRADDSA
jgi:hypothetical protein